MGPTNATAAIATYPHLTTDDHGTPILAGTTMKVVELVMAQQAHGWSPEELHFQFPSLPLGQIHAALAYYWDHQAELDAEIDRWSQYAAQARQEAEPSPLSAKLGRHPR